MSTHLPLRLVRIPARRCLLQSLPVRQFSMTASRQKKGQRGQVYQDQGGRAPTTMQKEAQEGGGGIDPDIGIIPGTFVRPPWSQLLLLRENPAKDSVDGKVSKKILDKQDTDSEASLVKSSSRMRIRDIPPYLWYWVSTRLMDWRSRRSYRTIRGRNYPVLKLDKKTLPKLAKDYHERIYKAFAEKDDATLSKLCTTSLLKHFRDRMATRPAGVTTEWSVEYKGARPASFRQAPLPIPSMDPTAIVQAVVHLRSIQHLTIKREDLESGKALARKPTRRLAWTPDGEELRSEQTETEQVSRLKALPPQTMDEYMVLQRMMLKGEEGEWKVWGFTEPTTPRTMNEDKEAMRKMQEWESSQNEAPSPT